MGLSDNPVEAIAPLFGEGLHFASVIVLGIVSYFLKRTLDKFDALEKTVSELKTKVAILLDRDRQQRREDYNTEEMERP